MPGLRRLIVAGLLTLLVGIVVTFPARIALDWFAPADLVVQGAQGTIWSGSAVGAQVAGLYVSDLQWRMRPLRVFTGELAYRVEGVPGSGFLEADVALGLGGDVAVRELVASVSLAGFRTLIGVPGLDGDATLRIDRLLLQDGAPAAADGTIEVANLLLPELTALPIGGYRGEFFTQQDGIVAALEDTDGDLDIAGSFRLAPDGAYQLIVQIVPKPQATATVRERLRQIPANERGQHELRIEGQF